MVPVIEEQEVPSEEPTKFVRVGREMAFGKPGNFVTKHDEIAADHGLATNTDRNGKVIVDDAGFMMITPYGDYLLRGSSTTCSLSGDQRKAREETARILKENTGKKVEI